MTSGQDQGHDHSTLRMHFEDFTYPRKTPPSGTVIAARQVGISKVRSEVGRAVGTIRNPAPTEAAASRRKIRGAHADVPGRTKIPIKCTKGPFKASTEEMALGPRHFSPESCRRGPIAQMDVAMTRAAARVRFGSV